jgi:hypothetical protein
MKFAKLFAVTAMTAVASTVHAQAATLINCGGATEAAIGTSTTTCRLTNEVSTTVPTVARLQITSTTTSLTAPLAADFGTTAGVNTTGPSINVKANAGYTLTASAATPEWSGPAASHKLATDLKMNVDNLGNVALGVVGTSSAATASKDYGIAYNVIYNWTTDIPGLYSLVVNYTLTAP